MNSFGALFEFWRLPSWAGALVIALALIGCTEYDGPPIVVLEGASATDGTLTNATAPIVLAFSKPVDPATLTFEIAPFVTDVEGNLPDEQTPPQPLGALFAHDPVNGDTGGTAVIAADSMSVTITLKVALRVGPEFVIVIEPGLASPGSLPSTVRRRIVFAYQFDLNCSAPVSVFKPGAYFFLVEVEEPVPTQVQLLADIDLDATTGTLIGQFTKASRNRNATCPALMCASTDVCRSLPAPACVAPSERAGTVDEFPDYVPNSMPPLGFTFTANGCAKDDGLASTTFSTSPVEVVLSTPAVTLRNTILTTSFAPDASGVLRGTGTLTADNVLLGTTSSGRGTGEITARSITAKLAPPGIPTPPPLGDD